MFFSDHLHLITILLPVFTLILLSFFSDHLRLITALILPSEAHEGFGGIKWRLCVIMSVRM